MGWEYQELYVFIEFTEIVHILVNMLVKSKYHRWKSMSILTVEQILKKKIKLLIKIKLGIDIEISET